MATAARLQAFVASRARQPAAIRCSLAAPQKPQRAHASAPRTRSVKVAAKNAVRRIDEEDGSVVFQCASLIACSRLALTVLSSLRAACIDFHSVSWRCVQADPGTKSAFPHWGTSYRHSTLLNRSVAQVQ